ncbi:MAG: ScpA family protein [Parcubacteria group bacterium]
MAYNIEIKNFSGPLDLLLQLIENEKLEITEIAIGSVTEQYLARLEKLEIKDPEELSDFLVVAARLLLLKSKALLPAIEEEEQLDDLARQLKLYKEFIDASKKIEAMIKLGKFTFSRDKLPAKTKVEFAPPPDLKIADLRSSFVMILKRLEPLLRLPSETIKKNISLKQTILNIRSMIDSKGKFGFGELLGAANSKADVIVHFMALLELLKQKELQVRQKGAFGDITIEKI